MTAAKTLGVLTSGGDCAGLNAVIRAVVCRAELGYGWRVLGVHQGTQGLLHRPVDFQRLDLRDVTPSMGRMAGTILGTTNRGDPFAYPMPDGCLKDRSAIATARSSWWDLGRPAGARRSWRSMWTITAGPKPPTSNAS